MRARSGSAIKNVYTRQITVRKVEPKFLTKGVIYSRIRVHARRTHGRTVIQIPSDQVAVSAAPSDQRVDARASASGAIPGFGFATPRRTPSAVSKVVTSRVCSCEDHAIANPESASNVDEYIEFLRELELDADGDLTDVSGVAGRGWDGVDGRDDY